MPENEALILVNKWQYLMNWVGIHENYRMNKILFHFFTIIQSAIDLLSVM